ncbi:unnamed protein product [Arctia plantaginis]|uniref:C2H2-type domain-containing protein n=1 Tax=Arctia plantaginis TaxID=874455 RepID=A0A8S1AHK5_ARCPL|nr:unnamed protein product [Arctia plantaginis]
MDSEKDVPLRKYGNIEYRCSPEASRITTNKVNPFDTVGNYHERRLKDKLQKKNNGQIVNIYDHADASPLNASVTSSNIKSAQEIRQELIEDVFTNHPYTGEPIAASYKRSDKSISQPAFNLPNKYSGNLPAAVRNMPKSSSFRHVGYNNYDQNNKHESFTRNIINKHSVIDENTYPQNVTNISPPQNMYNEEYVIKTMQRHARLQKIVRKLVVERQKEKQREAWNNYINELKNKHMYYSNEPTRIAPQYVPNEDEFTEDFWNTRYGYPQNDQRQSILNSLYGGYRSDYRDKYGTRYDTVPSQRPTHYYESNPYCYPTASQGRLMMLNREKQRFNSMPRPLNKYKSVVVDRDLNRRWYDNNKMKYNRTFPNIQTDMKYLNTQGVLTEETNKEYNTRDAFRKLFKKQEFKMATLKEKILQTDNPMDKPLENIEQKLDILINSVNSVIVEIKEQKDLNKIKCPVTKSRSISCTLKKLSDLALNKTKSESYVFQNDNDILYTTVLQNNTRNVVLTEIGTSTPHFEQVNDNKIARIIEEEMEKSEKIRKDIEELLHTKCNRQCSVEVEFDVPTREVSTFAANSLPQAQYCVEPERKINFIRTQVQGNSKQMTIAVNTDPLGLCALMQVSAETIKQLLSYMLNMNYESYMPDGQQRRRPCRTSHFICNICGETFARASQLSDHVESHYLGRRRNCCVCRHVLNMRKDRIGLFSCKYCGQKFTRAYCCELHQQACAKLFGRKHDVQSNLMLLR